MVSKRELLVQLGWSDFYEAQLPVLTSNSWFPARVICEERNLYRVQAGPDHIFWAGVSGRIQFDAKTRADYPAVGDWALVELASPTARGIIHLLLKRRTIIYRKEVGTSADMQILSTNVDYAFITSSVNSDLNPRRLERYLAVARESQVTPVVLLTKADVCLQPIDDVIRTLQSELPGVAVHALSKHEFAKAEFLQTYLRPGTTSVFIGSSGVGKSTLVNYLIGDERIKTQEVRESDGKGRHTTTSRNLYVSRFGGMIIDTPGMRELQLSDHSEGVRAQFADIEEMVGACRFTDCQHQAEPGCAVLKALKSGLLSSDRWQNYLKLAAEVRHVTRKQDKMLASKDRKIWKGKTVTARRMARSKGDEDV